MNLQQLEYIVAVDKYRHFGKASEMTFITQPTLSMMIRKLEDELGIQIFDRSRQPVLPTQEGAAVIEQAKIVLMEARKLKDVILEVKGELKGELKIGIIPTVAPYLLPLFLSSFLKKYPLIKIKIAELTTEQIVEKLRHHELDAGILATPLNIPTIKEIPLYYEQFVVYAAREEKMMKKKFLLPEDIDADHLWLLEEGHCLRSQVLNLCELRKKKLEVSNLEYEAGSIDTLKKIVDMNNGITILPEMAVKELSKIEKKRVRFFKPPAPAREISIVTYHHFVKQRFLDVLKEAIIKSIPEEMLVSSKKLITSI